MPDAVTCGDCGAEMTLRPSKFGLFYGCSRFPACKGTHGAHPDGSPMGIPSDAATRQARILAHEAFDALWRSRGWSRTLGYTWLRKTLGLLPGEAHISRFDRAQCEQLIAAVEREPDPAPSPHSRPGAAHA